MIFGERLKFHPKPKVTTPNEFIFLSNKYYREGTFTQKLTGSFLLCAGGIGDYVCWLSAITWVLEMQRQVTMHLYCQYFFIDFIRYYFKDKHKNRLFIHDAKTLVNKTDEDLGPCFRPLECAPNAIGMHLIDLGFVYFANASPRGEYRKHIKIDVSDIPIPELPENFAVVTTGHTTMSREWRPRGVNGVVDYLVGKGITPVFIGKKNIFSSTEDNKVVDYSARFSEHIDFSKGLDLREKTTLLEATHIMSKARAVVGLDNGLLHLAATQTTPIVAGMNIASPEDREFRRDVGAVCYVTPDPEKLTCTFCQTNQRFNNGQDFKYCFYKDYACLDQLSDPSPWIQALESVLG